MFALKPDIACRGFLFEMVAIIVGNLRYKNEFFNCLTFVDFEYIYYLCALFKMK
jgi:hypothetical protein